MTFHERIRQRRLQLGRTQRQVADAIGIHSADFISLVEQGRRRLDLERMPALAAVLELNAAELGPLALAAHAPHFAAMLFGGEQR